MPSSVLACATILCLIVFANSPLPTSALAVQDSVTVARNGGTRQRTGQIIDWKSDQITLTSNGRVRKIDVNLVVDFQTVWPEGYELGNQLAANKNYQQAIKNYSKALTNEQRGWVKQIILAEMIQAYDALESPAAATRKFLQLYQLDSDTRFFFLIPLPWSTGGMKPPADSETMKWMESKTSLLQLLGASWQLSGSSRSKATDVLEQLTNDQDSRIAQLAATQLWRTQVFSVNPQDVERWVRQLGNIDPKLRAGPLVILSDAQHRNGLTEEAQINLLKIPILFSEKKSLAAFALFRCGSIREDNQVDTESRPQTAIAIWRELIRDYPTSQYAKLAQSKF